MRKSGDQNTRQCGDEIAQNLRDIHPFGTAKLVSRKTGIPRRTVERILDGTSAPNLETFGRLVAAYPRLLMTLGVAWAEIAIAAVEMETLDRQRDDIAERARRAAAAMRSLR